MANLETSLRYHARKLQISPRFSCTNSQRGVNWSHTPPYLVVRSRRMTITISTFEISLFFVFLCIDIVSGRNGDLSRPLRTGLGFVLLNSKFVVQYTKR